MLFRAIGKEEVYDNQHGCHVPERCMNAPKLFQDHDPKLMGSLGWNGYHMRCVFL